jgi:hypothetical protein
MEFTEEFIKQNDLKPEQIEAVTGYLQNELVPNIKKEYEEEYKGMANKNAEGILTGASKYAASKFGVEVEREQGEKYGDYLARITEIAFEKSKKDLESKQKEIDEKLANFKGGEEYKQQLEQLKSEKDELLKKVAELEPLQGIDEKYQQATEQLTGMKKEVAYNSVKPNFPESVNKFEAEHYWKEWKQMVENNYEIELVDGKPIAVDKENHHKQIPLDKLLEQNEDISSLLKGRQQRGNGAKPAEFVDGLPFNVPKGASSQEQSQAVKEYLLKELGSIDHPDYSKKFIGLLTKVKESA